MYSDVMVLSKPCMWHEGLRIVKEEGFRAFWKGNMVTVIHRLPYTAVNFYAYERYKSVSIYVLISLVVFRYTAHPLFISDPASILQYFKSITGLESHSGSLSADMCVHFISGGLSGVTAASTTYPLDLIRTRLAAQVNKCTIHEFTFADVCVFIYLYRFERIHGLQNFVLEKLILYCTYIL